jgi:ribosomal protein L11
MPETKPKSLATKLAEITGLMAGIPKEGWNANQKYRFVRETDVAEKVSQLLAERGIFLSQSVVTSSREALYTTSSGATMWMSHVEMSFQFIDGTSGEVSPTAIFPGDGADTGDKGIYKAMTGAEKYFLMKTFLVSTGDDPEADEKVDKAAAAAGAAAGPVRVTKGSQKGVERGGRSAHATTAQVSEIARLAKKLDLDAESVVPVIKKVIGTEPEEGQNLREWLGALTSDQAAGIVTAMMAMDTLDADIGKVEYIGEAEQEDLPVS